MTTLRLYHYVGPEKIRQSLPGMSHRLCVGATDDILAWVNATQQPREPDKSVIVTFIIDPQGALWINDRRSEHFLCAGGGAVLSAGEMTFVFRPYLEVTEISNQSTGYCPEPASWPAVDTVLTHLNLPHPDYFTMVCDFRRCDRCHTTNLIKDDWFECSVCDSPLNKSWNFDDT